MVRLVTVFSGRISTTDTDEVLQTDRYEVRHLLMPILEKELKKEYLGKDVNITIEVKQ